MLDHIGLGNGLANTPVLHRVGVGKDARNAVLLKLRICEAGKQGADVGLA